MTMPFSCRDKCFQTYKRSPMLECMCDHACMFLGDCCYDYLLECGSRKLNVVEALHEQYSVFRRLTQRSSCVYYVEFNKLLRTVNICPSGVQNMNTIESMCSDPQGKRTISTCMPVVSGGILYRNMYCAACHGLALHQLQPIAPYRLRCSTKSLYHDDPRLMPFVNNFDCDECRFKRPPMLKNIERYEDACWCDQALPGRSCKNPLFEEECNAYSKVVYDGLGQPYNNQACMTCDSDGQANVSRANPSKCFIKPRTLLFKVNFFDFTGINLLPVCKEYYNKGPSGNPCLVKRCQTGFEIHDDICMSMITTRVCYPRKQNRHNPDFSIANLFRSAIVIHYKATDLKQPLLNKSKEEDTVENTTPCTHLPTLYKRLLPQELANSVQCALLYFDSIAFAEFSVDLSIHNLSTKLFPDLEVLHTMLLNHDPLSGVSCSGGTRLVHLTHLRVLSGQRVQWRSQETKQIFLSNKDPIAMTHEKFALDIGMLAFICRPLLENENCSLKIKQKGSSPIDSCLKYELTDNTTAKNGTLLLNSGKVLTEGEFVYTQQGTILVCVDIYDKLHEVLSYTWTIVVTASYTLSLVCLIATFVIYVRYRELRSLPGLMLMNLIVALFFAQLLFLMNAWGLFESDPILCLIMATAQHYFWLASFTWMGCMSLDIFRCLSYTYTTVNTYSSTKYSKYTLAGWGIPIPFPLTANVLTITTSSHLAYSTSGSCWMANAEGVLYLFAIPVFTIVGTNIIFFIGSVYCLCSLMKNASYVGRKEDNKQRLIQCIKLSSWMGISWLFGIIPNVVGNDALWYAFVTANALQGVHIFFAFGFSGRARVLMKNNHSGNKTSSKVSSTVQIDMSN